MDESLPDATQEQQSKQEEPSGLQVSILNAEGRSFPATASDFCRWYCTCEIPGKPQSHVRTLSERRETVDSGWEVVWDFTYDMPDYERGDSLMFTVWEQDLAKNANVDDAEQCTGTDSIFGKAELASAALVGMMALSRSSSQDVDVSAAKECLECELPLHDNAANATDCLATLKVRVSSAVSPRQSRQCSKCSSESFAVKCSAAPSTKTPAAEVNDVAGSDDPEKGAIADSVANALSKVINKTVPTLLTEVLTTHVHGLEETLVAELRRSEMKVIETISHAFQPFEGQTGFAAAFRRPKSREFKRTEFNESEEESDEEFGRKFTGRSEVGRYYSSGTYTSFASKRSLGAQKGKRRVSNHSVPAGAAWKKNDSCRSGARDGKQICKDMDSLQTNRILESFGLLSGPGAGRSSRPSQGKGHKASDVSFHLPAADECEKPSPCTTEQSKPSLGSTNERQLGQGHSPASLQLAVPGKVVSTLEVPGERNQRGPVACTGNIDSDEMHISITDADHEVIVAAEGGMPLDSPGWVGAGSMPSLSPTVSNSVNGARWSAGSHNMKSMRKEHEEMVMQKATSVNPACQLVLNPADEVHEDTYLPMWVMIVFGISNLSDWRAAEAFFWIQLLLSIGTLIGSVKFVSDGVNSTYCGAATAVLNAGSLVGLMSIHFNSIKDLAMALDRYSCIHLFQKEWMRKSKRTFHLLSAMWLGALLLQNCIPMISSQVYCALGISEVEGSARWPGKWVKKLFPSLAFAHISAIFMALLYCQFHILVCLKLMLDSFCARVFEEQDLGASVSEWNIVQAMLRRSARTVENCFVIVQTSALCALVLSAVGFLQDAPRTCGSEWVMLTMEHAPILILGSGALLLFSKGAAVTEHCTRVPSLVNSMELEDPVDETRQYVVNYIINSDAGFYVKDVRLTSFMALKITYVLLAAMVGLIVQLLRM